MSTPRSSKSRFRQFLGDHRRDVAEQKQDINRFKSDREKRSRYWAQYRGWVRPFTGAIVGIFLISLICAGLSLVLPGATMYIVDQVLPARDGRTLHMLGWLLLAILVTQQTLDMTRNWHTVRLNARLTLRLRHKLYHHLLRLPLHKLSEIKTGGVTSRLSGDIDSVTGILQLAILTPGVAVIKVVATIAILMTISWQLSVAATCLLPILVGLNLAYMTRIRPLYRSLRKDRGEIDARTVEVFGGIRVVRGFRREATEALRYATLHHTALRKSLRAQFMENAVWSGWGFLIPLTALVIIWLGGVLYLQGSATIGGIVAFNMYLMMLLSPVSSIIKSFGDMQQALAAMERVFDLLATPVDKPDRPHAIAVPSRIERIEFDDVSFAYPAIASEKGGEGARRDESVVLRDLTLSVPGGSTVALVGPSGAGKTTVTNLVARFYDPDRGAIRLNGVDLRDVRLDSYRRMLGLVQQDTFLFDGTIAENVAYGRPGASHAAIVDAARRANAHDYISAFPNGYETIVGERGVRLSGGQAQRISIARAVLADPRILILDEATSNLDSESEELIQASLRELLAGRTTFVIAHRLSTVTNADLIVVMENGRIVETGTHDELLAASGSYRTMVQRQFRAMEASVA
ncbi:MAG: ABC transporter ATP-binding protein [Phycisphaerae bacterium]